MYSVYGRYSYQRKKSCARSQGGGKAPSTVDGVRAASSCASGPPMQHERTFPVRSPVPAVSSVIRFAWLTSHDVTPVLMTQHAKYKHQMTTESSDLQESHLQQLITEPAKYL